VRRERVCEELEQLTLPMRSEWRRTASEDGKKLLAEIERALAALRRAG
jgi:hypothetical protein